MTKIMTPEEAKRASHDSGYGTGRGALYTSHEVLREQSERRLELARRALRVAETSIHDDDVWDAIRAELEENDDPETAKDH